jgi:hypothetical protein
MTAMTPARFERVCAESFANIKALYAELPELYERAYLASHSQAVRAEGGKVMTGRPSNPTEQVVGDPLDPKRPGAQASIRRTLELAPRKLANAENSVSSIEKAVSTAMDRLDPRETPVALRFPRTASDADLEESAEAKKRRKDRHEDIG